jgi:long-chain acyl-CoA synthetase
MHYDELKAVRAQLTAPGAPFEIETIEVRGIPLRSYKNAPPTVRHLWLASAAFAEREYLIYQDERITYGEAHRQVAAIGAWLAEQGVSRGDRVAIAMRNYPEWLLIYWACVCMGVAAVGMNAWWVTEEIDYALKDSAPKVIFCDGERLARLLERPTMAADILVVATRLDDRSGAGDLPAGIVPWAEVIAHGGALPHVDVDPDDDASIFYTSGTTGSPKGAQLTHRGCIANLFSMVFNGQMTTLATQAATGAAPDPDAAPQIPTALLTTPLFHVTANNCAAYVVTAAGGKLVCMYRWDPKTALELIEREKVTAMSGVPVMSRELISHPDFAQHDLSSLLTLGGGGAQLPPDLVMKIDRSTPNARPTTGYGMTETCGIITSLTGDFYVAKPSSVGPALPDYEVKCVDDAGNTVPRGDVGELWVRGAQVIKGYLNRPEATAEAITDGWLHTGDIARIDDEDFVYIVDRKKDMVLRGGENIYCAEVEACLYRHAGVAECSVFGVPDGRLGEEVGAAIYPHPGFALDGLTLREHCAAFVARHKIPRYIWIVGEPLPRNAAGKFLRRQLRETLPLSDAV